MLPVCPKTRIDTRSPAFASLAKRSARLLTESIELVRWGYLSESLQIDGTKKATDRNATVIEASRAAELLVLHRHLLSDPVVALWRKAASGNDPIHAYCQLFSELLWREGQLPVLPDHDHWQRYLADAISMSDTPFGRAAEHGIEISGSLRASASHDLGCLEKMFRCGIVELVSAIQEDTPYVPIPVCTTPSSGVPPDRVVDWLAARKGWADYIDELAALLKREGCGLVGRFRFLQFQRGSLTGVVNPDSVRLGDLTGYDEERAIVLENTRRFTYGLPANNLLLYGDRGTGKSATVKAVAAHFAPHGMRLVEVHQDDLSQLPQLLELLRPRSQRFIVFIDDLSFTKDDAAFKHLKAILEGTVQAIPENILVYATSNRRHLIAEFFSDQGNGEVRSGDSLQEKLALADRFGRTIIFSSPDQEEYLAIVEALACKAGLDISSEELRRRALEWTYWENSRSPRTAKQFITDLTGELTL